MHQIVLWTAMTTASGLFGGGRHCGASPCGATYRTYSVAAAPAAVYAPRYAAPAPAPAAAVPQTVYYQRYYYPPVAASCSSGTCPRR
jgi:hypothetical protein